MTLGQGIPEIIDLKSPDIASLGQYGKTPVSLSRGQTAVSIPLYTLQDGGITVPMTLSYKSSGVKVNQPPTSVGLNWSLMAGGMITRVIKGIPDETNYKSVVTSVYGRKEIIESPGYFYSSNLLKKSISNNQELHRFIKKNYGKDFEPDEFIFNFNGNNGRFYYSQNNKWVVEDVPGAEVEYVLETRQHKVIIGKDCENPLLSSCFARVLTVDFDVIKSFKFKMPNGLEYTFGEAETSFNFSRNDHPEDNVAWVLTKIYNPKNNEQVTFEYNDRNYIRSALEMSYFQDTMKTKTSWLSNFFFGPKESSVKSNRYRANTVAGLSKQLNKIISSNYEIIFDYGESTQLNYDYNLIKESASLDFYMRNKNSNVNWGSQLNNMSLNYSEIPHFGINDRSVGDVNPSQLNHIEIISKVNHSLINGYIFNYTKDKDRRLYLKTIRGINEAPFSFEYYNEGMLPRFLDQDWLIDHWGYYNNRANPVKDPKAPINSDFLNKYMQSRVPDENYTRYGSLKKIIYPTGGYTVFNYENNRYDHVVNRGSYNSLGYSINNLKSSKIAGGLRIKSIKNFDSNDNLLSSKSYSYEGGTLLYSPVYYIPNNSYTSFHGNSLSGSIFKTTTISELEDYGNIAVQYSKVTEKNTDSIDTGKIEYFFSNFKENSDYGFDSTISPNLIAVAPSLKMDKRRGRLLYKNIYSAKNKLIEQEINLYEENPIHEHINAIEANYYFSYGPEKPGAFAQATSYRINLNPYNLKTVLSNKYIDGQHSLSASETLSYNTFNFTEKKRVINSNNDIVDTEFSYANDLLKNNSDDKFIKNVGIETVIQELKKVNNNIVDGNVRTYKKMNNNIVLCDFAELENVGDLTNLTYPLLENDRIKYDSNFAKKIEFISFGKKGNLIEFKHLGRNVFQLWGYNGEKMVAKITGLSNADRLLDALAEINPEIASLDYNFGHSESELISFFQKLRAMLPEAMITSYAYRHGVGITSITNPSGSSIYYKYDRNRLKSIVDSNGNVIKSIDYNFKKFNLSDLPKVKVQALQKNTSGNLIVNFNSLDVGVTLSNQGSGNLSYKWTIHTQDGNNLEYKTKVPRLNKKVSFNFYPKIRVSCEVKDLSTLSRDSKEVEFDVLMVPHYFKTPFNDKEYIVKGGSGHFEYHWKITKEEKVSISNRYINSTVTKVRRFVTDSGLIKLENSDLDPCATTKIELKVKDLKRLTVLEANKEINSGEITIKCLDDKDDSIPGDCFVSSTKIKMADGTEKDIEKVKVGDKVSSFNFKTNKVEEAEVLEFVSLSKQMLVEITLENGSSNTSTPDHPYYVLDKGWCSYKPSLTRKNYKVKTLKLEVGDKIMVSNNKKGYSKITSLTPINNFQKVYNLKRVSKNHNYFANDMLVHNKSDL